MELVVGIAIVIISSMIVFQFLILVIICASLHNDDRKDYSDGFNMKK